MISILTSGGLINAPVKRTSKNGNPYVTAQMKAGEGPEAPLVSLVSFDKAICDELLALAKGDSLVVSGSCKPTSWTGRDGETALGLSVVIKVLMTQYGLTKKRKAAANDYTTSLLPAVSPLQQTASVEDDDAPF